MKASSVELEMRRVIPIEGSRRPCYEQEDQPKCGSHWMSAKPALANLLARTRLAGPRLRFRRRPLGLDARPLLGLCGWPLLGLGAGPLSALPRSGQPRLGLNLHPVKLASARALGQAGIGPLGLHHGLSARLAIVALVKHRRSSHLSGEPPSQENDPAKMRRKMKRYRFVPLYSGDRRRYFKRWWASACPITVL